VRKDLSALLWLLKLGAIVNLVLLVSASTLPAPDPHALVPAQILLAVSAFRCLFPNRYVDNVVFHDTALSSIFLTRLLATFSEVAYIYQFSHVIRVLNVDDVGWVEGLSWWMVVQVVVSQGFVWSAIVTRRVGLYFWEELGWLIIFGANTLASGYLHAMADGLGEGRILLRLSLLFGVVYLPWQVLHLRSLLREVGEGRSGGSVQAVPWRHGLRDALHQRNRRSDAQAWGGLIGLTWMVAYWATLIPVWVYTVAVVVSSR
jgi:hypothetical protein